MIERRLRLSQLQEHFHFVLIEDKPILPVGVIFRI